MLVPLAAHGREGGEGGEAGGAKGGSRSGQVPSEQSVQSGGTATNQLEAKEICMGFTVQVGL